MMHAWRHLSQQGFAIVALLCCWQATAEVGSAATTSSSNVATTSSSNQGNAQNITFESGGNSAQTVVSTGSQTLKNVPSMGAPNLTASNDTCMGSSSIGISIAGFGVSSGSTWTDANCVTLKNARELWNMGMRAAALALLCTDLPNYEALAQTGYSCPKVGYRPAPTAPATPAN